MEKYQNFIKKLLSSIENSNSDSIYTLSVYLPNTGTPIRDLQHQARVMVLDESHQHPVVGKDNQLCQMLAKSAETKIEEIDDAQKGIAVFLTFDTTKSYQNIDEILAEIIVLDRKPRPEVHVGRMFDVDQLLWMSSLHSPSLIAEINRNQWSIYKMTDNGQIKKITSQNNPYIEAERQAGHLHQYAPTSSSTMVHGRGAANIERRDEKENEQFFMDMVRYLQENQNTLPPFSYFVIAHSSSYTDFLDSFFQEFHRIWPDVQEIIIDKQFHSHSELAKESLKAISDNKEMLTFQEWKNAKEDHHKFVNDWSTLVAAARDGKIEILFVPSTLSKPGFVLHHDLPYAESVDGGLHVRNVVPWMVKRVAETDGKIVLSDNINEDDAPLAAKLRY